MTTERKWDERTRRNVVAEIVAHGSFKKASEVCGVPISTIRYWHTSNRDWWDGIEKELYEGISAETRGRFNNIIQKAQEELANRLSRGDERVLSNGKKVRQKVSARDLMVIIGVSHDKSQALALRGKPAEGSAAEADISGHDMLQRIRGAVDRAERDAKKRAEKEISDPDSNVESIA